eukprot:2863977-Amphidinium_carterae.2
MHPTPASQSRQKCDSRVTPTPPFHTCQPCPPTAPTSTHPLSPFERCDPPHRGMLCTPSHSHPSLFYVLPTAHRRPLFAAIQLSHVLPTAATISHPHPSPLKARSDLS